MSRTNNGQLTSNIPDGFAALGEQVNVLAQGRALRIERIVSQGHHSPPDFWYDQTDDEFVLVVSGAARLQLEGESVLHLAPGDWVHIPAHVRHRVEWTDPTGPTIWLAVFWAPTAG